jgi:hypothetical protein
MLFAIRTLDKGEAHAKESVVMSLKGLGAKTNSLAVNRQS